MCFSWIVPAHESWFHTSFPNSTFRDLMLVTCQLVMVGDLHHGNPYKEGFPHQLGSQFTSTTQLLCCSNTVEFGLLVHLSQCMREGFFLSICPSAWRKGFFCNIFWYYLAMAPHSSTLAWKTLWMEEPGGLQSMGSLRLGAPLSDFTFTFHFHALEKEMATHSSVLAWRIPGAAESDELPSMGSHRVRHDWSNLAAVAAAACLYICLSVTYNFVIL